MNTTDHFTMITFKPDEDYFKSVYDLEPVRLATVSTSLVLTLFIIPSLFSIVWYDWNDFAQRRIFINRLLSSAFLVCIADLVLVQIPDILRYLTGPFSGPFCFLHYVLKNTFAMQQIMVFDIIAISRYIFIFWSKNPAAMPETFWIIFTNIFVTGFSFFSQFAFALLPGRQSNIYYFCLGEIPQDVEQLPVKFNTLMVMCQVGSGILIAIVNLKIAHYKRRTKNVTSCTSRQSLSIENKGLESLFSNTMLVLLIAEVTFVINKINLSASPIENNFFPNNLYVNVFHLINPLLICGAGPIVYVYQNSGMKMISLRH